MFLLEFNTLFNNITINEIIELIFLVILLVALNLFIHFFIKRKAVYLSTIVGTSLILISFILRLNTLLNVIMFLLLVVLIIGIMTNLVEFRNLFANRADQKKNDKIVVNKKSKKKVSKIFDHEEIYKRIEEAVLYCSKNKIGALITIERSDDLSTIMRNGTEIDCPITPELLETIFYPGSRLHDGAVIIKDDIIVAASVYFTPTTKALSGKYGSRHRAALGISEICDAITIVVSEETGKISIAYNGELNSYSPDYFFRALVNTISFSSSKDNNLNK